MIILWVLTIAIIVASLCIFLPGLLTTCGMSATIVASMSWLHPYLNYVLIAIWLIWLWGFFSVILNTTVCTTGVSCSTPIGQKFQKFYFQILTILLTVVTIYYLQMFVK